MKKVIITTADTRKFISDILELGKQGGKLTDECKAYKGVFYIAEVLVPSNVVVNTNERVRLDPNYIAEKTQEQKEAETFKEDTNKVDTSKEDTSKEEVIEFKVWTKEELVDLTIKEVRDITGLSGRDKNKMIDTYLKSLETKETEDK